MNRAADATKSAERFGEFENGGRANNGSPARRTKG